MQFRVTNIHRRSNGTIDTDVYRRKALLLRRETTSQILRRLGRSILPRLIGAIAIFVSYILFLPRNPSLPPESLKTSKWNYRSQ